ncbi:molecular chaperone DnaJ [Tsukamurella sp. 8F]|uniref:molecular chaperone DnaJ n=1 Tax=unclassified Tsukamurella TaxID=2633480 RepID=UPI0023B96A85|nr:MULTISPECIES: molecular chaperone DnaJ [unclassified Tsukamurella]MDF0530020.1 molecular chaperone DnaJ [Tsukamurella sp. 8J]MDF0587208.1 molecular chaperone DnaJ [Tsukamurella sp. 8F]
MARDYYRILGVDSKATDQEIKRAYRKLARELHPDINPDEAAQERFRDVSDAYEVLSDPDKRRVVDMGGDPLDSSPGGFGGGFGGGAGFSGGLGDVFEAFFGGAAGGGGRGPRGRVRPGNDALIRMQLDLEECASGVSKEITVDTAVLCDLCHGSGTNGDSKPETCATCRGAGEVQSVQRSFLGQVMTSRPCPTCGGVGEVIPDPCTRCGGDGRVQKRRTMTVKIPAGVGDGMRVRLSGQGEVGPGGGPAGDLYVEVAEREHEVLVRDGTTLHVTVEVPMFDAALGGSVSVPTVLDGELDVEIPAGTQPADTKTVRGHGMPQVNTGVRGNLVVHFDVRVPNKLDRKQTEKLRAFKALFPEAEPTVARRGSDHHESVFSRLRNSFVGR